MGRKSIVSHYEEHAPFVSALASKVEKEVASNW